MGSADFAVPSLMILYENGFEISGVITQPDREKGRGQKISATPVKRLAESLGLPVFQPNKVNDPESVETIREMRPDIIVVVAFGQILKEQLLGLAPLGAINVHGSLLPKYRGAAPIHWAIYNGENITGVTTMYMDKGMDSGDIIYQSQTEIQESDDVGSLHDRLMVMGADLLVKTINAIKNCTAPRIEQDSSQCTYAPLLKKENELINWQRGSRDIFNHIRGFSPWPGAYTALKQRRIKLFRTECLDIKIETDPGTVIAIDKTGISVACGDGAVLIRELQPEGKARMTADAFSRGYQIKPGDIMG